MIHGNLDMLLTQGAKNSTRAGFPAPTSLSKLLPSRSTTLLAVTERARVTSGRRIEGRRMMGGKKTDQRVLI